MHEQVEGNIPTVQRWCVGHPRLPEKRFTHYSWHGHITDSVPWLTFSWTGDDKNSQGWLWQVCCHSCQNSIQHVNSLRIGPIKEGGQRMHQVSDGENTNRKATNGSTSSWQSDTQLSILQYLPRLTRPHHSKSYSEQASNNEGMATYFHMLGHRGNPSRRYAWSKYISFSILVEKVYISSWQICPSGVWPSSQLTSWENIEVKDNPKSWYWNEIRESSFTARMWLEFVRSGCKYHNRMAERHVAIVKKMLANMLSKTVLIDKPTLNYAELQTVLSKDANIVNDCSIGVRNLIHTYIV